MPSERLVRSSPGDAKAMARLQATDARWRGMFDTVTGIPSQLWGGSLPAAGANKSPAIAESSARAFIADHLALLAPGADIKDFILVTNVEEQHIRSVAFEQRAHGLRVLGGQLSVSFKHDRLFLVRSQALPYAKRDVGTVPTQPTSPTSVAIAKAQAAAWIDNAFGGRSAAAEPGEKLILPIIRAGRAIDYHVVIPVVVDSYGPRGQWDVFVDAERHRPIARRQRLHFGSGLIHYEVPSRYPGRGTAPYPVPFANHTVNGSVIEADAEGQVGWDGEGAAEIQPGLTSRYAVIIDEQGALASTTATMTSGGVLSWAYAMVAALDAQLSAFVHVNIAKRHALGLDPILPWLHRQIEVYVNEEGSCNAYSVGDDIHFFRSDERCENIARIADVVYHEFSHSFHHQSQLAGVGGDDSSLSEGVSDYFAATITGDPGTARGFYLDDDPVRHIDPPEGEKRWPDDMKIGRPHSTGLIISGALWDLRKSAIARMGQAAGIRFTDEIYLGIIRRAPNIPSTPIEALAYDDDDGDLGNGTPNECLLLSVFAAHGLGTDVLLRVSQPAFDGRQLRVDVHPAASERCPAPTFVRGKLEWKLREGTGGGLVDIELNATTGRLEATIPKLDNGAVIRYRVVLWLSNDTSIVLPRNEIAPYYEHYVGPREEIYCTDFETDPNWESSAAGGDNIWAVGAPVPYVPGEPASAVSGDNIYALGLGEPYETKTSYVARLPTLTIDTTRYKEIRLQYQRWLAVDDQRFDTASIAVGDTTVWQNKRGLGDEIHSDQEWRFHDLNLTDIVHAQAEAMESTQALLQVSYRLDANATTEYAGWALDDVCIVGIMPDRHSGSGLTGCSAAPPNAGALLVALGVLCLLIIKRRTSMLRLAVACAILPGCGLLASDDQPRHEVRVTIEHRDAAGGEVLLLADAAGDWRQVAFDGDEYTFDVAGPYGIAYACNGFYQQTSSAFQTPADVVDVRLEGCGLRSRGLPDDLYVYVQGLSGQQEFVVEPGGTTWSVKQDDQFYALQLPDEILGVVWETQARDVVLGFVRHAVEPDSFHISVDASTPVPPARVAVALGPNTEQLDTIGLSAVGANDRWHGLRTPISYTNAPGRDLAISVPPTSFLRPGELLEISATSSEAVAWGEPYFGSTQLVAPSDTGASIDVSMPMPWRPQSPQWVAGELQFALSAPDGRYELSILDTDTYATSVMTVSPSWLEHMQMTTTPSLPDFASYALWFQPTAANSALRWDAKVIWSGQGLPGEPGWRQTWSVTSGLIE